MSTFSPHDGTDLADCPFKADQRVRVIRESPGCQLTLGELGIVVDNQDLRPHHLSSGWYLWLRSIRGASYICRADQVEAVDA